MRRSPPRTAGFITTGSRHFVSPTQKRLIPAALISLMDVDEGVKEIKRAVKIGIGGVYLFPNPTNGVHYGDPYYDPFWARGRGPGDYRLGFTSAPTPITSVIT